MTRKWETFSLKPTSRVSNEIQVSLQKRGALYLNKAGYEALGMPEAVELLYEAETPAIGLKATDPSLPYAYRLRQSSNAQAYQIAFMSFARYHNIDISETRRFQAVMEDNVLVTDLSQRSATSGRVTKSARDTKRAASRNDNNARLEPLALVATGD